MRTRLQVLAAAERDELHERTLRVLASRGMRVDSPAALAILGAAGAWADEDSGIVRFPPGLVEWALQQAPKRFTLGGRREGWSFTVNEGDSTLLADGGATSVYDAALRRRRPPTHDDWRAATLLHDAFDEVGLYWCPTEYPGDYEEPAGFVRYLADVFGTFGKHVQDSFGEPALAPWLREVLDIVFGGPGRVRELHPFSFLITPASPLTIERSFTDSWLALRDYGLPVAIMPMPLQGATAPGSRLGTLLAANCETLGTLCLVQAAAPGTPVLYAPVVATMQPRTGLYAAGSVDHALLCVAATEMARHYGLPAESSGFCAQAYEPDIQAAWEKVQSALLVTLADPDVLVGPGLLGGAMVLSLEQIVFDVEAWRAATRAAAGLPVSGDLWLDDTLAAVGPCGSFLAERSTRRGLREGEWPRGGFGVQGSWDAWQAAGAPTSLDYARQVVADTLAAHAPLALPDDVVKALDALAERAARAGS